jgi:hypothetical protein
MMQEMEMVQEMVLLRPQKALVSLQAFWTVQFSLLLLLAWLQVDLK